MNARTGERQEMKIIAIIPARYNSTRFPGKPLALIGDKTMLWHVYNQAIKVKEISQVIIATDDKRIIDYCYKNNLSVMMTKANHLNGTERVSKHQ